MTAKILIADDEELERRAIRKILEAEPGFEILEAGNGVEVLALAAAQKVTVALLDIKMPGLDGIAVAESLRRDHPDTAIIFLTAYDQFGYARAALRLQVDDFLLKPASAAEVVATVRKVLDRVATREDARESSRAALGRLESAISLVAERLRHDLAEGLADLEQVHKFLCLQGMEGRPLVILEGRPVQPCPNLGHVALLAEAQFSSPDSVALAGVSGQTVRIMGMGPGGEPEPGFLARLRKFRDTVRTETGCTLLMGAATAAAEVHPDDLVAAAHRAATVANAASPVIVVSVGSDGASPGAAPGQASAALPPVVARALGILEDRMAEDISLNEVAALVGLSPSHLSRQLARATGNGFADCLAQFRIASAKKYLAQGSLSVKEVAHLVGFHDPAYFARVFRRLEGRSPADFRAAPPRQEAAP